MRKTLALWLPLIVLTGIIYLPGLHGPFLLDDVENFRLIQHWLDGSLQLSELVFGNRSGTLGRSLSMLTFAWSASLWGFTPFSFKTTNLLLHIGTGVPIFLLLRRIATRDPFARALPNLVPCFVTSCWLLHPLLASTVLYAVQRMTILATFFMVLGVLLWLIGRLRLERLDSNRSALVLMFIAMPCCTVFASLAKEIGVLTPLLCVVTECFYFRPQQGQRRSRAARLGILLFGLLPLAGGALTASLNWSQLVIAGYENREFSMLERTLSQPRFLWDYVAQILMPRSARMGIFHDDATLSTSLTDPWTTCLAIASGLIALAIAWRVRKWLPALPWGICIFLIGHGLESSFLPLLPYFEHRNYLPAIGILWAATVSSLALAQRVISPSSLTIALGKVVGCVLIASFALATYSRAITWGDKMGMLAAALPYHPESRWLRMELASTLMQMQPPNAEAAATQYLAMSRSPSPASRQIGRLGIVAVECFVKQRTEHATNTEPLFQAQKAIEADMLSAIEGLTSIITARPCVGLSPSQLADLLVAWLDSMSVSPRIETVWRLRFRAFQLYQRVGNDVAALRQGKMAWVSGTADAAVGVAFADALEATGDFKGALQTLREAQRAIPRYDRTGKVITEQKIARLQAKMQP